MPSRQRLWALAGSLGILLLTGIILDSVVLTSTSPLYCAFTAASLVGLAWGSLSTWPRLKTPKQRLAYGAGLYVSWRLTWFPVMVFSGTGAAYAESLALVCHIPTSVYPWFLVLVSALHAAAAVLIGWPFLSKHRFLWVVAVLVLSPAAAVSFSKLADLHPLPDRCWALHPKQTASSPVANPYLPALKRPEYLWHQRILLIAAGSTYDLIPSSPWSRDVQGTLEFLFRQNPFGSTADRVEEHYRGYLAAHQQIRP